MADSSMKNSEAELCELKSKILREHALVEASSTGDIEKVSALLNIGVSVDAEDYNKELKYSMKKFFTPLQLAASKGHSACLQIFIDHKANVNARDSCGVTALHLAAENRNYSCLKLLLESGADVFATTVHSKSAELMTYCGGSTALHVAATKSENVEIIKELIYNGADLNAVDDKGRTSLYIAAEGGFEDGVLAHIRKSGGRDILSLPEYKTLNTPLHWAVSYGMSNAVLDLLHLGSDANHLNSLGYSPLLMTLDECHTNGKNLEILNMLILEGYNTDINLSNFKCHTPLHQVTFSNRNASWLQRTEIAKCLISYGANINIKNRHGLSLLEYELKSSNKDYELLKYITRRMLTLPRLNSFLTLLNKKKGHSKKRQWYKLMASNPRSLQHCCRHNIRETIGVPRLKYVKNLPIPLRMQHYLLLKTGE